MMISQQFLEQIGNDMVKEFANRKIYWRRYRFKANLKDSRPVKFPPPGPWWETGFGDNYATVVAYLPAAVPLTHYWPDAFDAEFTDEHEIHFTERFSKPNWWKD